MRQSRFAVGTLQNVAVSTNAVTMMQLLAAANQPIELIGIEVSFDGASSTAAPVDVKLERQTGAGTSSAMDTAVDLNILDDRGSETLNTTGFKTFTVEPTHGRALWAAHVHPQSGIFWRPPSPIILAGGARAGLIMQAAAAVNVTINMYWGE